MVRGPLAFLVAAMIGGIVPAAADTLVLGNCTATQIQVKTYNQDDSLCWVPKSSLSIGECGAVTLDCEGTCKVRVGSGSGCPTDSHSGKNIYTKNSVITGARGLLDQPAITYFNYCQCSGAQMKQAMGIPD